MGASSTRSGTADSGLWIKARRAANTRRVRSKGPALLHLQCDLTFGEATVAEGASLSCLCGNQLRAPIRGHDIYYGRQSALQCICQRNRENRREQVDVALQIALSIESVNAHGTAAAVPGGHQIQSQAPGSRQFLIKVAAWPSPAQTDRLSPSGDQLHTTDRGNLRRQEMQPQVERIKVIGGQHRHQDATKVSGITCGL